MYVSMSPTCVYSDRMVRLFVFVGMQVLLWEEEEIMDG